MRGVRRPASVLKLLKPGEPDDLQHAMSGLPPHFSEKHIIGPGCAEWLLSARQLRAFQERGIEWAGISHVRAPYEIIRFHPPFGHLVAGLHGEGEVWSDNAWQTLGPGHVFLNPANAGEAMRVKSGSRWSFCWLHLGADFRPALERQHLEARDGRGLHAALEGLRVAFQGDNADPFLDRWCELVAAYAAMLIREGSPPSRLARLWDAVNEEPETEWTIDRLAGVAHMSREHLRRTALAETGRSPMQHVTYLRMQRAMNFLLSSERTVEAVAEAVGYSNPFVFSNAFLKWVGERPGAFRRAHGPAAGVVLRLESPKRVFDRAARVRPGQWLPIDLSGFVNRSLTRPGAAWFDGEPFPAFPPEIRGLYGVNFRAAADRSTGECHMLLLESATTRQRKITTCRPEYVIPVRAHGKTLYFLHAAAWVGSPCDAAQYLITYFDGTSVAIPVHAFGATDQPRSAAQRLKARVQDWYPHCEPFSNAQARSVMVAQPARSGARCGRVYVFEWRNPRPSQRIATVTVRSNPAADVTFGLIALTVLAPAGTSA